MVCSDRTAPVDAPKNVKLTVEYPPLRDALLHKWAGLTKRQTKELNPAAHFTILGVSGVAFKLWDVTQIIWDG
jgi:ubiquitin-like 1-activating enzyme E1 A